METTMKVNIKIIFPNEEIYDKTYKINGDNALKAGRRYAHHIIHKKFNENHSNSSYDDFLEYCGKCIVYIRKVL